MYNYGFNPGGLRYFGLPPKILLIMKVIIVIMTTFLLQVSAASFGQKVTIVKNNIALSEVFKEIRKQTGYNVLWQQEQVDVAGMVNVNIRNQELKEALDQILTKRGLTYTIADETVMVKAQEKTFLERVVATLANSDVRGRVVDAQGAPLPGATVKVKATGKAVSTDVKGNFYLKNVEEGIVLVVSYTGYISKEVKAEKEMADISLEVSLSKLDEVQVIAYGTTTQRLSTGNVTTIKADVIEKQPVNNPLLALQGRVPGLFIEQATGFAGTGVKVRIQGTNSLLNGNDPLYVIDGMPFTSQLMSIRNSNSADLSSFLGSSGSPLNFLNPADIESIAILKDADATAIYGSRAANGAILITTKKGKSGEIKVDINAQTGWGKVGRKLALMGSEQYLEMRREALKNDGLPAFRPNDYDMNGVWDNTRSTDWQKELIGGTAQYSDIQASVSGGSEHTTFLVGSGYHREGNVFPGDFRDIKASIHFNISSSSSNKRFRFQFSGSFLDDNNKLPQIDLTGSAMTLAPVAPSLYNSDGSINWQFNSSGAPTFLNNPVNYLFQKYNNKTQNLLGNALLSYEIIKGLEIKSTLGYNTLRSSIITSSYSVLPPESIGFSVFGNSIIKSWSIEPQIRYKRKIAGGQLELLLGSTVQSENRDASSITADGFSTQLVLEDIKSATSLTAGPTTSSLYKYNAFFGRANYNWEDKYIVNLTARRDGSSRFGSESRFHNFGAIGVAWVFSNEEFIKNILDLLSFGKLRASYGTTGSDQIGDYNFMSLYEAIPFINAPYQGAVGYQPSRLTNPYLQWEETKKLQIGLDLGFLKDRILINTNYSKNKSSNQLVNNSLPSTAGFGLISANGDATVQNSGWEFSISTTNVSTSTFKWSTSFNLTLPKNKLIAFKDLGNSPYRDFYEIGKPVNRVKLYHFLGVDPTTGVYQFQGTNGVPTNSPVSTIDDYIYLNTDPKYYGGFQNSFEYKGFQLDMLFQFTKQIAQNYRFGNAGNALAGRFVNGLANKPQWQVDRWQKPGDIADIQKYTTGLGLFTSLNNALNSDGSWADASYIRMKNVSISWHLPSNLKKWMHLQNCRIYVQGQNLFTITNYLGLDPESKSSLTLPPLKVVTMGLQIGL
ncbi:TonB-linked SusC/RagA family outer membrane protein [Pedobacter africanus]|uniref:TonB-linked SusC/RagA family outer membrane protein n=1 Tax=Pedobacter africanus TaxID=151894 RepID=A0ACC6L2V3_9SPHI|nr:SusC/RagA family TonB-linked outer membrane protein [Pedobacter africanus]MDR6785707.1 TonB-linked SusC/RagA family outer membrane protein [Pedobacter africanus]